MIRGQSLISVFFVTAFAALQGCAADTGTADGSEQSEDSLVDSPATDSAPTGDTGATGSTEEGNVRSRAAAARTIAATDQRNWGAGEPHPIPWHESKTSAVNAEADEPSDLTADVPGDDTPDQAPTPPSANRR